jgi:hypothetical protein
MASPTCPTNNNYKQTYLAIKYDYDTYCSMSDEVLDAAINKLDTKVKAYENALPDNRPAFCFNRTGQILGYPSGNIQLYTKGDCESMPNARHESDGQCIKTTGGSYSWECRPEAGSGGTNIGVVKADLSGAFQPISQYYSNLMSIKKRLSDFLECSADKIQDSNPRSVNKERFFERANPQDSVMPRELVFGLFSQLKPSSIPFIMAAGVFMSCLALLIIFQMFGFTGEIHIPPALSGVGAAAGTSSTPLHQNPMVLSGISIVLGAAVIILGIMYYRSKK